MVKTMKNDIVGEYFKRASIIYLIAAILSIFIVLGGLIFYIAYILQDVPGVEEVEIKQGLIESITAPEGSNQSVSEKLQKSLTAPDDGGSKDVQKEVLESLTAPE